MRKEERNKQRKGSLTFGPVLPGEMVSLKEQRSEAVIRVERRLGASCCSPSTFLLKHLIVKEFVFDKLSARFQMVQSGL